MARLNGKNSGYSNKMEKTTNIFSIIWLLMIFWLFYIYFKNINKINNFPSLITALIIFSPLTAFTYIQIIKWQKISKKFHQGQVGEALVLLELLKLPDNYSILQDIKFNGEYWNTDFVVIGPTGIFTIEVKSHKGFIEFNKIERQLTINNLPFEKNIIFQANRQAMGLRRYLMESINFFTHINPVIVFSSYFTKMRFGMKSVADTGVQVIQKRWLRKVIEKGTGNLDNEIILKIEKAMINLTSLN